MENIAKILKWFSDNKAILLTILTLTLSLFNINLAIDVNNGQDIVASRKCDDGETQYCKSNSISPIFNIAESGLNKKMREEAFLEKRWWQF